MNSDTDCKPHSTSNIDTEECDAKDLVDQIKYDAILAAEFAANESKNGRDCDSDAALALILQRQFDLDYDSQLKKEEARLNGQSKVGVSLDNFRRAHLKYTTRYHDSSEDDPFYDSSDSLHGNNIDPDLANWDAFDEAEFKRRSNLMVKLPYFTDRDGKMVTKHDIPTSSRKNMCRLMELKTDIQTGDAGATKDNFKIANRVYNSLKVHSKKSFRRENQRLFDKRERENAFTLDGLQSTKMSETTRAIMDGLLAAYKIEQLNGVIGHGKESTVLHGIGLNHQDTPGQEIAIKIFKSDSNMTFKTRETYNKSKCPSYKFDKPKSKSDSLNKWAERGFKNLKILSREGINCPDVITLKKHVLVMTFLGLDAKPSPRLREAKLDANGWHESYKQVIDIMVKMYKKCELIHGDLSEYNLLWHNRQVFVIDVSQSMSTSHPNAYVFLYRDCRNITDFYRKSGMLQDELMSAEDLFKHVCDKELCEDDVELWSKIDDFPCNEKLMKKEEEANRGCQRSDDFEHFIQGINSKNKLHRDLR